jgi:hypothetical protein
VRDQAAALLREVADREETAGLMLHNAIKYSVRTPPFVGYDEAAVCYTRARTWQACARELDRSLPEVQPAWD